MREAAAPALPAVRSIAQIWWRADMVSGSSLVSPVNVTDSGKARVNREAACSGKRARKSSADGDRSEVLTGCFNCHSGTAHPAPDPESSCGIAGSLA